MPIRTSQICLHVILSVCAAVVGSFSATAENLFWGEYPPQCASGSALRMAVVGQPGFDLISSTLRISKVVIDGPRRDIYWSADDGKIRRARLDGSKPVEVITVSSPYSLGAFSVDSVNQKLYWIDRVGCAPCGSGFCPNCPRIRRSNLDGTIPEIVYTMSGSTNTSDITIDPQNAKVYWSDSQFSPYLKRINFDGTNPEDLVTSLSVTGGIRDLTTDSKNLYWTEASLFIPGNQILRKSALDGSSVLALTTYVGVPLAIRGLSLDPQCRRLYYSLGGYCPASATADIFRVDLDTLNSDHLYSQIGLVTGLAVDAGADADSDGVPDCTDRCPNDRGKSAPGVCGCGISDADGDGDGILNCKDACPSDPGKATPGICGCGVSDVDSDASGVVDCLKPAELKARVAILSQLIGTVKRAANKKQKSAVRVALNAVIAYARDQGTSIPVSGNTPLTTFINNVKNEITRVLAGKSSFSRSRKRAQSQLNDLSNAIREN